MNEAQKIKTIIETMLKSPNLPDDVSRQNFSNWDSLKHLDIVFALEEELGVTFDQEDLPKLNSIPEIIKIAKERRES